VLDPFSGTGKTGQAAIELGRRFIGIDLKPEYCEKLAAPRLEAAKTGLTVKELEQGQKTLW
jgi:DNA modification methylase